MKTVGQWFMQLPEPYRLQALDNGERGDSLGLAASSMAAALCSFAWEATGQGYGYWEEVFRRAEAGQLGEPESTETAWAIKTPETGPSESGPAEPERRKTGKMGKRIVFAARTLFLLLISPLLIPFTLYSHHRWEHRKLQK